jgi:hypothetical protein
VKDVNIDGLLQVQRKHHQYALLSCAVVDAICEEYLAGNPGDALKCRPVPTSDQPYGGNYLYNHPDVFDIKLIGMADSLAMESDERNSHFHRNYLLVAPGKRTIDADPFFNREDNMLVMAIGIASAVFGQSRFQQWVTEGLEGKLLTVTASDALLIGDFHDIDRKMPLIEWLPDWPISAQSQKNDHLLQPQSALRIPSHMSRSRTVMWSMKRTPGNGYVIILSVSLNPA